MSTIREQIVSAVMTYLGTFERPEGIPAPVRTRVASLKPDQLPAITVYQTREIVDPIRDERPGRASRGAIVRRALDLRFEIATKAVPNGTPSDGLADPILAWISSAMAGIGNLVTAEAARGLCNQAPDEIGTAFEFESVEYPFCRASLTYRFLYQSSSTNAEALT